MPVSGAAREWGMGFDGAREGAEVALTVGGGGLTSNAQLKSVP